MRATHDLTALLDDLAREHGERVALAECGTGRTRTFTALRADARALAGDLAGRGVGRGREAAQPPGSERRSGDVLAVWLPNVVEYPVWVFAAARLGAAVLGVNTRYGRHEVAHLLDRAAPVGAVVPAEFLDLDLRGRLDEALAARSGAGARPWVAVVGAAEAPGAEHPGPAPAGGPDDPVAYFTTSGSTGAPKLAGHPQSAVAEHAVRVAAAFDMRPGDALHLALPLCGVFGFSAALGMLAAGGTVVLEPVFDPDRMVRDVAAHGVTHLVGGDDMLGRLMASWAADPVPWPRLRRGAIADFAGRAPEIVRWAQDEHGAALAGVYGSSELFALVSTWPPELPVAERVRAGGVPVAPGIAVRAVNPDGAVLPPGETGELEFRGYPVTTGYLGGPDLPQAADGWFASGDLGSTTADGAFHYLCRAGDALRLRGFLVEPAEIEAFLLAQEGVTGAKVVGAVDPARDGATVAVAFVTLAADATLTGPDLVGRCRAALAAFKVPARVEVLAGFPTTTGTNGTKIRTADLRECAAELLDGADAT